MPEGCAGCWLCSAQIVRFLHALHPRRSVILLWDGLPAHRSRITRRALATHSDWLRIEPLPAYAPELNPVEELWAHLDANTPADDLDQLGRRVRSGVQQVHRRSALGRAFLSHTGLF
jgi:putative transposase